MRNAMPAENAQARTHSTSGCFVCRLRGRKCTGGLLPSQSCEFCSARHIKCILCAVPVPNLIRDSEDASQCRHEVKMLSNPYRHDIAELPVTQAYYDRLLRLVRCEDETTDEQTNQSEAPTAQPMFSQWSHSGLDSIADKMLNDVPHPALAVVGNMSNSLAGSQTTEQSRTLEWTSILHSPPVQIPAPVPASGLPQGPFWDGNGLHDAMFPNTGAGPLEVPTDLIPMPHSVMQPINPPDIAAPHSSSGAPVPFIIDLRSAARNMGFLLIPNLAMPGPGA